MKTSPERVLSVAPMLDWTDRHCRYFLRQISSGTLLFSEMVTTGALLYGDVDRHLRHDGSENPLVLQLGGSDPVALGEASQLGQQYGYDEINLNIGCPSSRVQSGAFGACLMANPSLVADCFEKMQAAVNIPVSIKCRIGIDDQDSDQDFADFIDIVAGAGCQIFYVHARKAWLEGLSPKQNRDVPPLNYERVYRLKSERPDLQIILNGGLQDLGECQKALTYIDGVMVGRQAYQNPWWLRELEEGLFSKKLPQKSREDVLASMIEYARKMQESGVRLHDITRHMMGLYHGQKGAKFWRRCLSDPLNSLDQLEELLEALNRHHAKEQALEHDSRWGMTGV